MNEIIAYGDRRKAVRLMMNGAGRVAQKLNEAEELEEALALDELMTTKP